ncbi:TRAP transporter large permease [Aurantivibrio plasticivorans]
MMEFISPEMLGVIGFIMLLVLLAGGMPIGFALGFVGFVGLAVLIDFEAAVIKLGVISFSMTSHYELGVIPLYLLMAHVCFASGASRDFFNAASRLWGHHRGGLAIASVGGCAGFGAVSGSSLATAATMGLVSIPEMRAKNYSPKLATGSVAAGGTVGSLIPPSGMLIVLGILTEQSIGKLFAAGILPGVTQALFYVVAIAIICRINPTLAPTVAKASWKEKIQALSKIGDLSLLIFIVIGGLLIGWFTPTESGAIGALGAITLAMVRKRLTMRAFIDSLYETLRTAGMLYVIIIGAFIFSTFISASGLASDISDWILNGQQSTIGVMLGILLVYFILGMFLDGMAMMALTIPIFYPIIQSLGISGIWFGVLVVRAIEIALITPPVGMNAFVIHGISKDIPLKTIFAGIGPFLIADLFHVVLLLSLPILSLWLPSLM